MRKDLKEAIMRIHSDDYHKLLATEKQLKKTRRSGILRTVTGWDLLSRAASRVRGVHPVILIATLCLAVYCGVAAVYYFNRFSLLVVDLDMHESKVANELQRRANLIPNLLVVSAEYGAHEKVLYQYVSEMRSHLANGQDGTASAKAPLSMDSLMSSLLAVAEEYPDLKATQSFEQLMADWRETEDRIAEARIGYIETIREYNGLCSTFPSNVYAFVFNNKVYDLFSPDDSAASPLDPGAFYTHYLEERIASIPWAGPAEGARAGLGDRDAESTGAAPRAAASSPKEDAAVENVSTDFAADAAEDKEVVMQSGSELDGQVKQ
jgi:LemA protein